MAGERVAELSNYKLLGPATVTAASGGTPDLSWQWHLNSGSAGGVDLVASEGTAVLAATAGFVTYQSHSDNRGNGCRLAHEANVGWSDEYFHLQADKPVTDGAWVAQGTVIAYSGKSGGVAAHLHRHLISPQGARQNPWDYFSSDPPVDSLDLGDAMPYLLYKPAGVTPVKRAYYRPGSPLRILTTTEVNDIVEPLMKQFRELPSSTATSDVTANVTEAQWDWLAALEGVEP